ncbi:hypothetical protein [Hyphomicrobium sp.]|uniref:DUF3800 domain-containing protein n=1 Tax=Hyphomicrobium sp. TaxID=82 RepID=UPI00132849D1|nr:hypothetical protein [Hyphomicrobium sp.]KAB2937405.1 MAG: DUF3800 domain-containing protein [Hyphomicrobium sp.]
MMVYLNPFAATIPSKNWFYCWLTRLLLERVTYFALKQSIVAYGQPAPLQIELSERGRFSYGQLRAYYDWLKLKSMAGQNKLPLGDISWDVMSHDHFEVHPNERRPGLQLADAVAGAFLRACDVNQIGQRDVQAAKLLKPVMTGDPSAGMVHGFSVKLMPKWGIANLTREQQQVFRFYGYPLPQWWMPKHR